MSHVSADLGRLGSIRSGSLEVRLAQTLAEIEAAQRLRYDVFYREMAAHPTPAMEAANRDFDEFDTVCDHLLVIDHNRPEEDWVVGTYRLIRREMAARRGSFYSASEFDIARIIDYPGEVLELGRACVASAYRGRAISLLFRGIAGYAARYNIEIMFGCASLPGTDPEKLALPLSYLYHYYLAPPALRAVARPERYIDMRRVATEEIDPALVLFEVSPLLKAYLRLGGFIGDGAVIDHQFQTTDVCVIVKTDLITDKYARHYQPMAREVPSATGLDE
ncbi:MAG TPA: GNAT family N-acyltransferase [Alphaproteobacteria bacterium]|nr:GNAT family N-acyltransferase [Alphaproteobacteria bacterium]